MVFFSIVCVCVCVCVCVAQSCMTLCNPMDCSPPDTSVRNLQARILVWVAIPSPGDLPDPGIEPGSPALQTNSLPSETPGKTPLVLHRYLFSLKECKIEDLRPSFLSCLFSLLASSL